MEARQSIETKPSPKNEFKGTPQPMTCAPRQARVAALDHDGEAQTVVGDLLE